MQKVIYLLWRDPSVGLSDFNKRLNGALTFSAFRSAGSRGLQLNIQDEAVRAAERVRQISMQPPVDAVVQVWVDSAIDRFRKPFERVIGDFSARFAAYLVNESTPLPNRRHPPRAGSRTEGFSQIALFAKPARLTYDAWLEVWQRDHTVVATETQDHFLYVQNVVARALTYGAPAVDAIVEECFPEKAMADAHAFFNASGNEPLYQENLRRMMESCNRFIDFDKIDVIPTSQYLIDGLAP